MRMFILKNCPHCRRAINWIKELKDKNPEYRKIEIELVDEQLDSQLADMTIIMFLLYMMERLSYMRGLHQKQE